MKSMKLPMALLPGTLGAFIDRHYNQLRGPRRPRPIALANTLGLINDNGIESLLVDPASTNLPFSGRIC